MRDKFVFAIALALGFPALGAGLDTNRINGDDVRGLLGDGTGVVVGVVDSGIDINHPSLVGTVSGGLPRLAAQANFVSAEPANTGDDVYGHGTAVASQILSRDAAHLAVATDSRYINARVLDASNGFASDGQVVNGTGFALSQGANLLNLSLGHFNANTSGQTRLALMSDYITFNRRIPITVSAGNAGNNVNPKPQGPGDGFNIFSVASTSKASNWSQIVTSSSYGPTTDGRNQPSIAAPGDQVSTATQHTTAYANRNGTSFAAPNLAGVLAGQIEYGLSHGLSVDPLVLKATVANSAEKVRGRSGTNWAPSASSSGSVYTATSPLDASAGAGQVDGFALARQYMAGNHEPGDVPLGGWDLQTITGTSNVDYHLGQVRFPSAFSATLNWFRHVGWTDADASGSLNGADSFFVSEAVDNLDLSLFRDGSLVAQSISTIDNLEHLFLPMVVPGDYVLRVTRLGGGGVDEQFGLAWLANPLPEPSTALGMMAIFSSGGRRRRTS